MNALLTIILPVFLVVGFGYLVSWRKWFSESAVDGLMIFAQNFAVPVLLFSSMARLDLGAEFRPSMLISFYLGAWISFFAGWAAAKYLLKRAPQDCVVIGFTCLFSNTVLLGIPITERAYGPEALAGNWTIIALHSPLFYTFGISFMEFTRAKGSGMSLGRVALRALSGTLRTPMVIGILCGFAMNLLIHAGLVMPDSFWEAVGMISHAALPAALFGLGGVLYRYRPEGDISAIVMCCACSLILHPAIVFGIGSLVGLDTAGMRSGVMTASMAPGVNAYLFANFYGAARRVAASTVLIGTALSILSIWMWLAILP
ncbi:AEC family transporter [Paracoccus onubensis]|uniref:AEC family transporter n=1 Tax=Paracoccus onubensis TaxID=1675788 RepID=UPI0027316223|nr:AEC family transporter [Paracoccus onubensis]MDP0929810.1 AEC family transporter [Paracoccus onubensis]